MKYIVFFILWKSIPLPCPEQSLYEQSYGKGYTCAVYHSKRVRGKDTLFFDNKKSSDSMYTLMLTRKDTSNQRWGKYSTLIYPFDSIGTSMLTEVKNNKQ